MDPLVVVEDLTKHFNGRAAVRGVSFQVLAGEAFGLLGPNGAGKTTTISMLACLLDPTSGDATIAGHSIRRAPMAVRRAIGVVPQEIALYPLLTARENLDAFGRLHGVPSSALRERVDRALDAEPLERTLQDHAALLSPAAGERLEELATASRRLTHIPS